MGRTPSIDRHGSSSECRAALVGLICGNLLCEECCLSLRKAVQGFITVHVMDAEQHTL